MDAIDAVSVLVVALLGYGLWWAHGAVQRVTDRSNELTRRSQARQAYDVEREAARVPLSGAKR